MSLNIKNPEAHALAKELAELTGESMTEAILVALKERLARELNTPERVAARSEAIMAVGRDVAARRSRVPGEGLGRRAVRRARAPSLIVASRRPGLRRDHAVNRFLRSCNVQPADEIAARRAAHLRIASGRASISAVDAVVAAMAAALPDPVVLTGDPHDLAALAAHADRRIAVVPV